MWPHWKVNTRPTQRPQLWSPRKAFALFGLTFTEDLSGVNPESLLSTRSQSYEGKGRGGKNHSWFPEQSHSGRINPLVIFNASLLRHNNFSQPASLSCHFSACVHLHTRSPPCIILPLTAPHFIGLPLNKHSIINQLDRPLSRPIVFALWNTYMHTWVLFTFLNMYFFSAGFMILGNTENKKSSGFISPPLTMSCS